MSFGSASVLHKAAIPVSGLAAILQVVAVSTVGWYKGAMAGFEVTYGLWKYCSLGICRTWRGGSDFVEATQAMETIGMILCIVATILLLVHILVDTLKSGTFIGFVGTAFASALFITIGVIVWGTEFAKGTIHGHVFYSFGLAVVAAFLMIISGILGLAGRRDFGYNISG